MVGSDEKLWILLDGVLKKLLHGKYWSTSADEWNDDLKKGHRAYSGSYEKN